MLACSQALICQCAYLICPWATYHEHGRLPTHRVSDLVMPAISMVHVQRRGTYDRAQKAWKASRTAQTVERRPQSAGHRHIAGGNGSIGRRSNRSADHHRSMLDAVMFRLYRTFATNQTGNTVFLTLAAVHWGSARLIHAVASLCGFFTAGLIMGQLGARFGEYTFPTPLLLAPLHPRSELRAPPCPDRARRLRHHRTRRP